MAKIKNIIRGDSHTIEISFSGEDLSTYDIRFTVKPQTDASFSGTGGTTDPTAVITKDPGDFVVGTDTSAGYFLLTPEDTDIDPDTDYYYDIEFTDGDGNITSVARDSFSVVPDVTRRSA